MPSNFRIPKATPDGVYGRVMTVVARRMWGEVPDNAYVLLHHKPVTRAIFGFEQQGRALEGPRPAPQDLRRAGQRRADRLLVVPRLRLLPGPPGRAHLAKVREVPRWRESEAFTDLERDVMAYAEAMTRDPAEVTDEMVAALDESLGHEALVELTMMIAVENERSRFNSALGLASQGYADRCELAPLAVPSTP